MKKLLLTLMVISLLAIPAVAQADLSDWPTEPHEYWYDYEQYSMNYGCPLSSEQPTLETRAYVGSDPASGNNHAFNNEALSLVYFWSNGQFKNKWKAAFRTWSIYEGGDKRFFNMRFPADAVIDSNQTNWWFDYASPSHPASAGVYSIWKCKPVVQ